jgi:hypothetical protein
MTTAYKLLRKRADGTLGPLFINRNQVVEPGTWLDAEAHPTKGFAFRPGWHCAPEPKAPHLKTSLKSGERRVWCEVQIADFTKIKRPAAQGGAWFLADKMQLVKEIQ